MEDASVAAAQEDAQDADDIAIPESEQAEAAAEVAAMEGTANSAHHNNNNANRIAEEAVLGAGAAGFEETDESGKLVQERFVQFLGTL